MNEHIERMVEESEEIEKNNWYERRKWLRTALTSAYNLGLERAKEVVKEREEMRWNGTIGVSGLKYLVTEKVDLLTAIEKEKIAPTKTDNCPECQFEGGHSFECPRYVPIDWKKISPE